MGIIAHHQLKKTGISETHLEVKQRVDFLEDENERLILEHKLKDQVIEDLQKENKKLKAALKKLKEENEKLKNPKIWMNDGEL